MRQRLTERDCKELPHGDYWDAAAPGLNFRVSKGGVRSFRVRYKVRGKNRSVRLGRYPEVSLKEARAKAYELLGEVRSGVDPIMQRVTFKEAADQFMERHARRTLRDATVRNYEQILRAVEPVFGERPLGSITRGEVVAYLDTIDGAASANRQQVFMSTVFNWAVDREMVGANPIARLRKRKEESRDRVLDEKEIAAVWRAADELHPVAAAHIRMLLALGQRWRETALMKFSDVDDDGVWTIPAENAKNRTEHRVPLNAPAKKLLGELREMQTGDLVFESWRAPGQPIGRDSKATAKLVKEAGVEPFRPHDLRRTVATQLAKLGCGKDTIDRVQNHVDAGMTRIYVRYSYEAEVGEALRKWGERLEEIVAGNARKQGV